MSGSQVSHRSKVTGHRYQKVAAVFLSKAETFRKKLLTSEVKLLTFVSREKSKFNSFIQRQPLNYFCMLENKHFFTFLNYAKAELDYGVPASGDAKLNGYSVTLFPAS